MTSSTSIVIASWNSLVPLRAMLTKMHVSQGLAEVIVVDNHSTDGTPEMVAQEFPTVKVVRREDNRGFPAAANKGLLEATGQTVIVCHADVLAEIHELQELADRLQSASRAAVVLARLKTITGDEQPMVGTIPTLTTMIAGVFNPALARKCDTASLDHLADHQWSPIVCAAIDATALQKIGSFDESFLLHFADTDFCRRVHEKGLRILIHPDISVAHAGPAPGGMLADHQKRLVRKDFLHYVAKHGTALQKLLVGSSNSLRMKLKPDV